MSKFKLKEIIENHLQVNGFDGLWNCEDFDGCACKLGADFMPCDSPTPNCCAGYLQPKQPDENSDFDFSIGAKKHEAT